MKDYDRILVTRDEANEPLWRIVAARFGADLEVGNAGGLDVVVPAGAVNPATDSAGVHHGHLSD